METPVSRSALYGKLAGPLFRSLESATAFCKLRSNPWVELTHWLHQLTQQPDTVPAGQKVGRFTGDMMITVTKKMCSGDRHTSLPLTANLLRLVQRTALIWLA